MASLQPNQRIAALILLLTYFTSLCSANCLWYTYPDFSGATCNSAPDSPDSSSSLETILYIIEDTPGDCTADYNNEQVYQFAVVTYVGLDGSPTVASAFNAATDRNPEVTGTYTFSYDVPYASIQAGSNVTHAYQWTSEGGGVEDPYTFSFVENHNPTMILTDATSTVTYPFQTYTETTITSTRMVTQTDSVGQATSTVIGTRTIFAPRATTTTTRTITRAVSTVYKTSATTITRSVGCITGPTQRAARGLKDRQEPVTYEPPNCAEPTTTTYTTSVSIVLEPSTTVVTDTDYQTVARGTIHKVGAQTVYRDIVTTVTVTPRPLTRTTFTRLGRSTVTRTKHITVTKTAVPPGGPKRCGDWSPHWPTHRASPLHGPRL